MTDDNNQFTQMLGPVDQNCGSFNYSPTRQSPASKNPPGLKFDQKQNDNDLQPSPSLEAYLDEPAYFNNHNKENNQQIIESPLPYQNEHNFQQNYFANHQNSLQKKKQSSNAKSLSSIKISPCKRVFTNNNNNIPYIHTESSNQRSPGVMTTLHSPQAIYRVVTDVNTATFKQLLSDIQPQTPHSENTNAQQGYLGCNSNESKEKYQTFGKKQEEVKIAQEIQTNPMKMQQIKNEGCKTPTTVRELYSKQSSKVSSRRSLFSSGGGKKNYISSGTRKKQNDAIETSLEKQLKLASNSSRKSLTSNRYQSSGRNIALEVRESQEQIQSELEKLLQPANEISRPLNRNIQNNIQTDSINNDSQFNFIQNRLTDSEDDDDNLSEYQNTARRSINKPNPQQSKSMMEEDSLQIRIQNVINNNNISSPPSSNVIQSGCLYKSKVTSMPQLESHQKFNESQKVPQELVSPLKKIEDNSCGRIPISNSQSTLTPKPFKPSTLARTNQRTLSTLLNVTSPPPPPQQNLSSPSSILQHNNSKNSLSPLTAPGNAALCVMIQQLSSQLQSARLRMKSLSHSFEAEKQELNNQHQNQLSKEHKNFEVILNKQRQIIRNQVEQEQDLVIEQAVKERVRQARIEWQSNMTSTIQSKVRMQMENEMKQREDRIFSDAITQAKQELEQEFHQSLELSIENQRIKLKKDYESELDLNVDKVRQQIDSALNQKMRQLDQEAEKSAEMKREEIRLECMRQLRSEREKELHKSLSQKLRCKIERQLYQTLGQKIESEIRREYSKQMQNGIEQRVKKEYNVKKRMLQEKMKEKLEEREREMQEGFKAEYQGYIEQQLARKEKEYRAQAKIKIQKMRKQLQQKFDKELGETIQREKVKIDKQKAEIARMKSSQNVKGKKLEQSFKGMERKLAQKEHENARLRTQLKELRRAHQNLSNNWMYDKKVREEGLLTSRTSTGRSQILSMTNGSGFHSTRGSVTNRQRIPEKKSTKFTSGKLSSLSLSSSKSKNSSVASKNVVPNNLRKGLQNKRKKLCGSGAVSANNSVNVSRNSMVSGKHDSKSGKHADAQFGSGGISLSPNNFNTENSAKKQQYPLHSSQQISSFTGHYQDDRVYIKSDDDMIPMQDQYKRDENQLYYNLPRQIDHQDYNDYRDFREKKYQQQQQTQKHYLQKSYEQGKINIVPPPQNTEKFSHFIQDDVKRQCEQIASQSKRSIQDMINSASLLATNRSIDFDVSGIPPTRNQNESQKFENDQQNNTFGPHGNNDMISDEEVYNHHHHPQAQILQPHDAFGFTSDQFQPEYHHHQSSDFNNQFNMANKRKHNFIPQSNNLYPMKQLFKNQPESTSSSQLGSQSSAQFGGNRPNKTEKRLISHTRDRSGGDEKSNTHVRFEPGRQYLFESYIKRFREKEEVFQKTYITDANRIVQNLEKKFVEGGSSDHGLLGYLCDLWDSLGVSFERRVNFLHDLEKKMMSAMRIDQTQNKIQEIYNLLNEETAQLANQRKNMIGVLSLIRKKEKLAEVIRKNPKNKIKKSEHMNSRLTLYQAVQDYRRKNNNEIVFWKGQIVADILKYEKWVEDNEMKGQIRQELLEKRRSYIK